MADGQVIFEITADGRHAIASVKEVTNAIDTESRKWDKSTQQSTGTMDSAFSGVLKNIGGYFAAAKVGQVLLEWGKAAVEAASDLAEVQNVVDTVFGDNAGVIEKWAKKAGTQFGLTETQAKKFTSTLGAMMKSSGLAGDEIVGMSTDLAGLAADMASFYNLDFETAFEKIRSGISGETEPLKQLGINMSVANLNAFALEQGLEKTFDQMTQGEQVMLRYQYMMRATADAQGDFEKTSDGFANAQRRIQTALNTIQTVAGGFLLNTIEPLVSGVAELLEKMTTQPERTVLDDFNDIEVDTAGKMADLESTYLKAQDIIKLLDDISKQTVTLKDGSTMTFEELFGNLGNIESNGGNIREYIEGLGLDVDFVTQKYSVWKESTKQLTALVPDLTSVIDAQTGAIDGGTEALQKNLDEWKATQEKKIAWAAYYAKLQAIEEKKGSLYLYEFDAGAARKTAERLKGIYEKAIADANAAAGGRDIETVAWEQIENGQQIIENLMQAERDYTAAEEKAIAAEEEYTRQAESLIEAQEQVKAGKEALIEKYGEEAEVAEDASESVSYLGKSTEEWATALKDVPKAAEALTALADYYEQVRDATEQTVEATLHGFEKIGKAGDEVREKLQENGSELAKAEAKYSSLLSKYGGVEGIAGLDSDAWSKLPSEVQNAYNEIVKLKNAQDELNQSIDAYSPKGMIDGLQSQIDFIDEYLANLERARELGLSADLLAELSDGSKESAEMLSQIADADAGTIDDLNSRYAKLQEKKSEFTGALTESKLAADDTYNALVQKAIESIDSLNLQEQAAAAMGDTVAGIAQGIRDNVPEVESAVDALLEQLDRLESHGMSFSYDGDGVGFQFSLDGSFEKGLDYVPFSGFLAELHEGEGILTAEENRVWQRFKNGQAASANVDYDALGGLMRDNVQAGGNVYLDGRTVGRVVSGIQGDQYRTLQRSGWQQ